MGGNTAAARDRQMAQLLDRSFNQSPVQLASNAANGRAVSSGKDALPAPKSKSVSAMERGTESTPQAVSKPQETSQSQLQMQKPSVQSNDGWSVQIGSYQESGRAHAQAKAASRWVPGEVVVTEVEISNRKMYRARLVGLQEHQARSACQNLTRQGMGCLVVRS